jgi:NADH-quinone oxidoreductase subunit E
VVYLFFQTWIWLLLAGLLGLLIGWLIWGKDGADDCSSVQQQLDECRQRNAELESSNQGSDQSSDPDVADSSGTSDSNSVASSSLTQPEEEAVPEFLDQPDGDIDDLKRISGIGPVLEKTLNNLGIFHFRQIAAFTSENIDWVNNYLSFSGRIERENWVAQAAALVDDQISTSENRSGKSETGDTKTG